MVPALSEELRLPLRDALDQARRAVAADGTRIAAALLPLLDPKEELGDPELVFTRRTEDLPRHPGEISFPGGMREALDAGPRETALREAEEELGISPAKVEIL